MHIAITGGSGRIGHAVIVLALQQGHSVTSIDQVLPQQSPPAGVRVAQLDMTNYTELAAALVVCDAMVHLAAIPTPTLAPEHVVHNNNVTSSYNAMLAAINTGMRRICQASSVNATGAAYSRWPHFDYMPLDEQHPSYNEDPYSLSKWICEQQADSLARRYKDVHIASLRFHWIVPNRDFAMQHGQEFSAVLPKQLWGYTNIQAAAQACLLSLTADFTGHEVFYIVAPKTMMTTPSQELKRQYFPDVALRSDLNNTTGFFNCAKAERLLGWQHDQ